MAAEVRRRRIEPLWDRVDRNRWKMWFFVGVFTFALALTAEVLVVVPLTLFALYAVGGPESAPVAIVIVVAGFPVSAAAATAWVAYTLNRSEYKLVARLGATRAVTGELHQTKHVLHEMAIAAGLPFPPALYVLDCTAINAFILGRTPVTAIAGITTGMLKTLTPDEQRAVFANLLARLRDGDTRLATVASALMSPVWAMRDRDLRAPDDEMYGWGAGSLRDDEDDPALKRQEALLTFFPLYFFAVVITELLYHGQMQQQILTSEAADARGMLLLKDPRHMLSALERTIPENNLVGTAGAALAPLFFCWSGMAYVGDEDPEMRRIARLRETLGAEGVVCDRPVPAPPLAPRAS